MSDVESLKKQAKTREEIRIETRELKRTEETDGCYNPFNIVHPEVQRRLKEKWIPEDAVLPLLKKNYKEHWENACVQISELEEQIADLKNLVEDYVKTLEKEIEKKVELEGRLSAIQKHIENSPKTLHEQVAGRLDNYDTAEIQKWKKKLLGLVGEEQ